MEIYRLLCPVLILQRIGLRTINTKTETIYANAINVKNTFMDTKDDHYARSVGLKIGPNGRVLA
jgi:hypothetical protein